MVLFDLDSSLDINWKLKYNKLKYGIVECNISLSYIVNLDIDTWEFGMKMMQLQLNSSISCSRLAYANS